MIDRLQLNLGKLAVAFAIVFGETQAFGQAQSALSTRPEETLVFPPTASPNQLNPDRFFLFVFTSQSVPKIPKYTHTWAVMIYVQAGIVVDVSTISWMPADLQIKPLKFSVEPGVNESYQDAIRRILIESRQRISLWGPYEAHPSLYERFIERKTFLESGKLGYQCVDCVGEAAVLGNGGNCVHSLRPLHGFALGDVLEQSGDAAGEFITRAFVRDGLAYPVPHESDWLMTGLGIQSLPVVRRTAMTAPVAIAPNRISR